MSTSRDSDATDTLTPRSMRFGAPRVVGLVAVFAEDERLPVPQAVQRAMVIGRDDDADMVLLDRKVSRHHARIEPCEDGVRVVDLGSHNGTRVDGTVVGDRPVQVGVGSILRVGNTILCVVDDIASFIGRKPRTSPLVGGPALDDLRERIAQVAPSQVTVLLEGETGVGKELVARTLHELSGRSGELVAVNCAALPGQLIEAELFGHGRGAFSGADGARRGLVRLADGGTLFLDEVGEMAPATQPKLLRVLESSEVRAVGEDESHPVNVRFVAATNVDLARAVEHGTFRPDLFHRLSAVRLHVAPLRERREDIPALVNCFLPDGAPKPNADAMEALMLWGWPGNVRELRQAVLEACMADVGRPLFGPEALPAAVRRRTSIETRKVEDRPTRERLVAVLTETRGNVSEAARKLGTRRAGVYEQLHRHGIDAGSFRSAPHHPSDDDEPC